MLTEIESNAALEKVLDEIRNINRYVLKSFIFQNNKLIAKDKFVSVDETSKIIQVFEQISNQANAIEGLESVTVQASNGRLDINRIDDFYIATVTSNEANPETIDNLTHVLIPGIFNIIRTITPTTPSTNHLPETNTPLVAQPEAKSTPSPTVKPPQILENRPPTLEYTEFTVDDVGGLGALSSSADSVKLDGITFGRWTDIFGESKTFKVSLKIANSGKTLECNGELSKDSKHQRETIFLPELIQRKLNVKKRSKILVKPLIDQDSKENLKNDLSNPSKTAELTKDSLGKEFDQDTVVSKPEKEQPPENNYIETQYSEFTVEDMGKLGIIAANTVKLHLIAIGHWTETYGVNKIQAVVLKDHKSGKTIECKCETSKDPKHDRNSVRMPESLQRKLQLKKGSKVQVKPIIKNEPTKESTSETSKQLRSEAKPEKLQSTEPIVIEQSEKLSTAFSSSSNSPNCQLMVRNVSGLSGLREPDLVFFDKAIPMRWKELYGDRKIQKVDVAEPNLGKSVKSKFRIVGGSKFEGKGLIQLPKAIQNQLSVKEGSLVIVKPVLE